MKPTPEVLLVSIRAKCLDCSGGMRKEVQRCNLRECPLWPYRTCETTGKPRPEKGQISIFEFETRTGA